MKRQIETELIKWKNDPSRLPLLIRGARQVGKSYVIESFGNSHFDDVFLIDFELKPDYQSCFTSLDPNKILSLLELKGEKKIIPGKTLLVFDEIQECPQAIMALRYFKEKRADLHVIAAGSFLEFTLDDEKFSFPVGRIQYLYMKPLSFEEFLLAMGKRQLVDHLSQVSLDDPPDPVIHQLLLDLIKLYLFVGGMPAVVAKFLQTQSLLDVSRLQNTLLQGYRDDFPKYHRQANINLLELFFDKSPHLIAQHFKYTKVGRETRARDLKVALEQLCLAALLSRVFASSANGVPLAAEVNEKKFKLLFLDVGLLQTAHGFIGQEVLEKDVLQINRGSIAEQFVGQELLAMQDPYLKPSLFFWKREKVGSSAEVDYLFQFGSKIFPIEVKAGTAGHLRSLKQFLETKQSPFGIRISEKPLSFEHEVLSIPFYLLSQLKRILKTF